jgi:hypothetical protein
VRRVLNPVWRSANLVNSPDVFANPGAGRRVTKSTGGAVNHVVLVFRSIRRVSSSLRVLSRWAWAEGLAKMQPTRPKPQRSPSSITIAPPSKDPRYRRRDTLSPQDALLNPYPNYGFAQRPVPSRAVQTKAPGSQPSSSKPLSSPGYTLGSASQRIPNEAMRMMPNSDLRSHSAPVQPPTQARSAPALPLIAYAGRRPVSSSDANITSSPISKVTSATLSLDGPMQKLRQVVSRPPSVAWGKLPSPALEIVLNHLRTLHVGRQSTSCMTCYMRDLTAMHLTCTGWSSCVRKTL